MFIQFSIDIKLYVHRIFNVFNIIISNWFHKKQEPILKRLKRWFYSPMGHLRPLLDLADPALTPWSQSACCSHQSPHPLVVTWEGMANPGRSLPSKDSCQSPTQQGLPMMLCDRTAVERRRDRIGKWRVHGPYLSFQNVPSINQPYQSLSLQNDLKPPLPRPPKNVAR